MASSWQLVGGWALALGLLAADAGAEGGNAAQAQALFDAGLKEMLDGQYASGCPKLEQSYALDPVPGALFTLAACYERWGKLRAAREHYQRFVERVGELPPAQASKHDDRLQNAAKQLEQLKARIPTLTVRIEGAASEVTLDDTPLAPEAIGTPQPIDPGEHRVVAKSASGTSDEESVTLAEGDRREVVLALRVAPAAPYERPAPAQRPEPEAASGGSGVRTAGFVIGSVGLAGVIVGAVTGGLVFAKKGTVDENCVELVCNAVGKQAADDAATLGMVSNVSFGVGLAAMAAGVLMVVLAPDDGDDEQARMRFRGDGRGIGFSW